MCYMRHTTELINKDIVKAHPMMAVFLRISPVFAISCEGYVVPQTY